MPNLYRTLVQPFPENYPGTKFHTVQKILKSPMFKKSISRLDSVLINTEYSELSHGTTESISTTWYQTSPAWSDIIDFFLVIVVYLSNRLPDN